MRFDFNESNILNQNLFATSDDKNILLNRLRNILQNTEDVVLKDSVQALIQKVQLLTDEDVKRILYDILKKRFIVTSNHKIICKK